MVIRIRMHSKGKDFTLARETGVHKLAPIDIFSQAKLTITPLYTGNHKQVIWQTVKTQMKCGISSGSALVAEIKPYPETKCHRNSINLLCDPSEHSKFVVNG